jgi:hypothetical protein
MDLLKQFGWGIPPSRYLERADRLRQRDLSSWPVNTQQVLWSATRECSRAALGFYLAEDCQNAFDTAERLIREADEYFFGEWKDHVVAQSGECGRAWWDSRSEWVGLYESVLMWATLTRRMELFSKLAILLPALRRQSSLENERSAYYKEFCCILMRSEATVVEREHSRLGRISRLANAYVNRKATAFAEELDRFLRCFENELFDTTSLETLVSVDASMLVGCASFEGWLTRTEIKSFNYLVQGAE